MLAICLAVNSVCQKWQRTRAVDAGEDIDRDKLRAAARLVDNHEAVTKFAARGCGKVTHIFPRLMIFSLVLCERTKARGRGLSPVVRHQWMNPVCDKARAPSPSLCEISVRV